MGWGGADGIYPYAMRATISEEASEDNPFGILDLGIRVFSEKLAETVYKFRMKSAYEDEDTVSVKAAMYLDQVIVDNTKELNFEAQFFAADLDHNVENSGQGTIVAKDFSPRADDRLYPEGRPLRFVRSILPTIEKFFDTVCRRTFICQMSLLFPKPMICHISSK